MAEVRGARAPWRRGDRKRRDRNREDDAPNATIPAPTCVRGRDDIAPMDIADVRLMLCLAASAGSGPVPDVSIRRSTCIPDEPSCKAFVVGRIASLRNLRSDFISIAGLKPRLSDHSPSGAFQVFGPCHARRPLFPAAPALVGPLIVPFASAPFQTGFTRGDIQLLDHPSAISFPDRLSMPEKARSPIARACGNC